MSKNQRPSNMLMAFADLMRMRIVLMVLVSCAIGYILSYRGNLSIVSFLSSMIGTGLLTGGACALNCFIERDLDALMPRTCNRAIPSGVISPRQALLFGLSLSLIGASLLFSVNMLSGILGSLILLVYLGIYTPLKRLTCWNTSIGAIPGAIPPLIGCAAAGGELQFSAWVLFAMLFLWQHVHFFPIAWLYKEDYRRAGFKMLPVLENGRKTFLATLLCAVILLPVSLFLYGPGFVSSSYAIGALLLGALFIMTGFQLRQHPSRKAAHAVLIISLFYLPVVLGTVLFDRYGTNQGSPVHAMFE